MNVKKTTKIKSNLRLSCSLLCALQTVLLHNIHTKIQPYITATNKNVEHQYYRNVYISIYKKIFHDSFMHIMKDFFFFSLILARRTILQVTTAMQERGWKKIIKHWHETAQGQNTNIINKYTKKQKTPHFLVAVHTVHNVISFLLSKTNVKTKANSRIIL